MTLTAVGPEAGADLEPVERLSRDIRDAARMLTVQEARYLVSMYYETQEQRIRMAHQLRAASEAGEPSEMLAFMARQFQGLERSARRGLQAYAEASEVGQWAMSLMGIGPVLAAGLLAHIDVTRAATAGAVWRFAGLDPTSTWGRKQKRPWNADLKKLAWKIGESFVRVQGREGDVYGRVFAERKALEIERNEVGLFADQAAAALAERNYGADTVARAWYEKGMLPPARIHARARRYAVKLFLAHYHHVAYEVEFGYPPPRPYVIEHGGHAHFIAPPNWPVRTEQQAA